MLVLFQRPRNVWNQHPEIFGKPSNQFRSFALEQTLCYFVSLGTCEVLTDCQTGCQPPVVNAAIQRWTRSPSMETTCAITLASGMFCCCAKSKTMSLSLPAAVVLPEPGHPAMASKYLQENGCQSKEACNSKRCHHAGL